jgi:hypothetical protein
MDPAEETHGPEVYRVAVRLPPFWPEQPIVWFGQAKAQFKLAGITRQRTKFNYVVSQLNNQQAAEVEDPIASPPEHDPSTPLSRISILPHSSRPIYALAGSLPPARHHSIDSVSCPALWLDIQLWLSTDNYD